MHKTKFSIAITVITISLLMLSVSAQTTTGVLGVWRDINPTAYISPPANPPLKSVYMLSANEGWAVGDSVPSSESSVAPNHAFPAILHYDATTWNLVPAPKNPTEFALTPAGIVGAYNLTSVNFGPPDNPFSRNNGWAVGFGFEGSSAPVGFCGTMGMCAIALHWDGITWRPQLSGFTTSADAGSLFSVFMIGPTDVWAVGQFVAGAGSGVFWHWSGSAGLGGGWTEPQGPVATGALYSVFMVSSSEGWAVGNAGSIYHYFGGTWTTFPSPTTKTLRSVFMISQTEGWAVGDSGTIIHYSAGTWSGPVSPGTTSNNLLSVFMVSSTEGWAHGKAGTILHYSGGTWTALPINLVPTLPAVSFIFASVYLNSAMDGWAVGTAGVILHYDGVNWGTLTSPTLTKLTSISFGPPLTGPMNPNDGWAVGAVGGSEPTIIHWNGFMWTKGVAIGTTNNLMSVFMVSSGDVWAVGGDASLTSTCTTAPCPVILHYTGGSWNTITPPNPTSYLLNSVFMVSPNEGWAVGVSGGAPLSCTSCGVILHYTVTGGVGAWATFPVPPSTPALNSVFMLGPNEGWAVGNAGTVMHYTVTGGVGTWNLVAVSGISTGFGPPVANLTSVFMLSPTSGWIVGGFTGVGPPAGPIIIYWDGTHWTTVATPTIPGGSIPTPPSLNSVYCTGPEDCWTVGGVSDAQFIATIFHWDGVAWSHVTLSPSLLGLTGLPPILTSVYMISPTEGWIVGSPLPTSIGGVGIGTPLSTILRFSPFGGLATATSTTTIVSTVSTSTIAVTATTTTSVVTVPGTVQVTIKVVDNVGNAVQGANVTIASLGLQGVTNSQGIVTFTVPLGTYTVTVSKGSGSATPSINVIGNGQTFTLTLPGGGAGIPGFPLESILAGLIVGIAALSMLRRLGLRGRNTERHSQKRSTRLRLQWGLKK